MSLWDDNGPEVKAKGIFSDDELSYLIRILGGPSDQGIKTLGEGLTATGAIALRKKLEAMRGPIAPISRPRNAPLGLSDED